MVYIILSVIFCVVILSLIGVLYWLRIQTIHYVKLGTYYTNQFMNCEMTIENYAKKRKELRDNIGSLLSWYMKKVGITID